MKVEGPCMGWQPSEVLDMPELDVIGYFEWYTKVREKYAADIEKARAGSK